MRFRHDPTRGPSPRMEHFSARLRERGVGAVAFEHYVLILADSGGLQWEHHVYRDVIEHLSADKLAALEDAVVREVGKIRGDS